MLLGNENRTRSMKSEHGEVVRLGSEHGVAVRRKFKAELGDLEICTPPENVSVSQSRSPSHHVSNTEARKTLPNTRSAAKPAET